MTESKKLLVTGGAGFIGSNTVSRLVDQNDVTVIDDLSNEPDDRFIRRFLGRGNFRFIKKDITKPQTFDGLGKFDLIIHLAANSDVKKGSENPDIDFKQNIVGTKNVLDFMKNGGCSELLFSSTSAVYGEAAVLPTPETYGPCMPISSYGASKLADEGMITAYSHYYGIRASIFRFANVVGINSTHGVIFDFINRLRADGSRLDILGDGTQAKSYIHVSDCVDAMLFLHSRSEKTDVFNLGNEKMTSVRKIADIVVEKLGLRNVRYEFVGGVDGRGWKGDVKKAQLDTSKVSALGWKNRHGSDAAVEKAVEENVVSR